MRLGKCVMNVKNIQLYGWFTSGLLKVFRYAIIHYSAINKVLFFDIIIPFAQQILQGIAFYKINRGHVEQALKILSLSLGLKKIIKEMFASFDISIVRLGREDITPREGWASILAPQDGCGGAEEHTKRPINYIGTRDLIQEHLVLRVSLSVDAPFIERLWF
ncbi:hypothetical protein ACJX0J_020047 [Zea mays]